MKVAVVVSTFPPYRGGMGNAARDHAEALERAGHKVTVLAPGRGLRPVFRWGNAAWAPQLVWKLRGFDAVELHYPFFGGAEFVWLWKKLFGRRSRLAVFYHMDTLGRGWLAAVFKAYRAVFLKPVMAAADRVLVSSRDYLAHSQVSFLKNDPRVREVPFSVDTRRFRPEPSERRERAALFVGNFDAAHYFKGLHVLIEAFILMKEKTPDAELWIVGGDALPTAQRKALEAAGAARRVRVLGRVSDEELPGLYRRAAVHVLPSIDRSEAFGLVTLAASASGTPSAVSDLPGVRAVIEPGATGLVVRPSDPAALAEALRELLSDPARAEAMGSAARRRAERLYARGVVDRVLVDAVCGEG